MAVQVSEHDTFESFLDDLRGRDAVRVVKMADYGFVAPLKTSSGAIVMAPQVRVVATAFDKPDNRLLRWQSTRQATSTVTVGIGMAQGIHGDVEVLAKREDLGKWLELEGFSVSDGEWTTDEIERIVAKTSKS